MCHHRLAHIYKTTYALTCFNAKSLLFVHNFHMTPSERALSALVSAIGWSWGDSSVGKNACWAT